VVEQETVGLYHELLHWRLPDNPVNQIRPKERFAAIERKRGGGIFFQETIKQVKTDVQFRGKMGIDFDLGFSFILTLFQVIKCPCPAVPAAEVAVISEDKMEVQENPSHYET
jgi:hypothetical protein